LWRAAPAANVNHIRVFLEISAMMFFAQTTGNHNTGSPVWTPIAGLAVKLPRGVGESALVILNVPNPYAKGSDFPGGNFGLRVNGTMVAPFASFTYSEKQPVSGGRVPTTLCAAVPLSQTGDLLVEGMWQNIRGSTVYIDSPATLTALID
jgi:mannose-binding lectin